MVELTQRQRECVRYLCRLDSFVTVAELAQHVGVSVRTMRSELGVIEAFVRECGARLVRVPGSGVCLDCDAAARSRLLARSGSASGSVLGKGERVVVMETLLLVRPTLTFSQMAEACGVSRQTVVSQIDDVSARLREEGLLLSREQGVGSSLSGPELSFRRLFLRLVSSEDTAALARETVRPELGPELLGRAERLLADVEDAWGATFSDPGALLAFLAYVLLRVRRGRVLPKDAAPPRGPGEAPQGVRALREVLAQTLVQPQEQDFVASVVLAQRTAGTLAVAGEDACADEAELISRDLIDALRKIHDVDDTALQRLIEGLTAHLRAALWRCRNDIQVTSELPCQIMASISLLYDFTRQQLRDVERRYGVHLNEAEVAYVAMYLDAIFESSARGVTALTVVFVCPFGLASSSVLMTRLSYALAECDVRGPMTESEAQGYVRAHEVDLVISTYACQVGTVPVLTVDPLLGQVELEKVKSHIMQRSYAKMCSYFLRSYADSRAAGTEGPHRHVFDFVQREDVTVGVVCEDWREAIRLAARPLLAKGLIEERYVRRMVRAVEEYGPYMVLTPLTAYAHAGMSDGVRQNCASVLVLRRDIPFGPHDEKRVRCVIVVGIHDMDQSPLIGLAPIFEREESVRVLQRADLTADQLLGLHD